MNAKKSESYAEAAAWLRRAKASYAVVGRTTEWNEYLAGLLEEHQRKYKLVPLLKELR